MVNGTRLEGINMARRAAKDNNGRQVVQMVGVDQAALSMIHLDAEYAAVGAMLLDREGHHAGLLIDILGDGTCITGEDLRAVYLDNVECVRSGVDIDAVTMASRMKSYRVSPTSGGSWDSYLIKLFTSVPCVGDCLEYAKIVRDLHIRRESFRACLRLQAELVSLPQDGAAERVSQTIGELSGLLERRTIKLHTFASDLEEILGVIKSPNAILLPTQVCPIDKHLGGLGRGTLNIIAARTSIGKTWFGLKVACGMASCDKKTLFISAEMKRMDLYYRLMSIHSGNDVEALRRKQVSPSEQVRIACEVATMKMGQMVIIDDQTRDIDALDRFSRSVYRKTKDDLGVIIVDYLQLLKASQRAETRALEVGEISGRLKDMAMRMNIPVLAMSQFNREVEHRDDQCPRLADLRESGSIEQDADVVMALWRKNRGQDKDQPRAVRWRILKNRHGLSDIEEVMNLGAEP